MTFFDPELVADAQEVAFSGNPYTLTRERPVIIIHYFHALALYGREPEDKVALAAAAANAPLLAETDRTALFSAMRELLSLPSPHAALALMQRHGVLPYALGFPAADFASLEALAQAETLAGETSGWQARLLLLILGSPLPPEKALAHLQPYWALDAAQMETLQQLLDYFPGADPLLPENEKTELTKKMGADFVKRLFFLRWALEDDIRAAAESYQAAIDGIRE